MDFEEKCRYDPKNLKVKCDKDLFKKLNIFSFWGIKYEDLINNKINFNDFPKSLEK